MSPSISHLILVQEPFLILGALSWAVVCLVFCTLIIILIYCVRRIRKLKNEAAELRVEVVERNELLTYSVERERKATEQSAQANQSKKALLSRVNHEIRTPMNGVIGMAALLAETSLTAEQSEYNETIRNCGEGLMTVINDILHGDLLAQAKLETSKIELQLNEFDLRNCVEEVLDVFSNRVDIDLLYNLDHQIPKLVIGDVQRLRQVLMNLVENAVKFTNQGEVFIQATRIDAGPSNRLAENSSLIHFEIRDTGAGIPEERLNQLIRGLHEGTSGATHTGVGLFISHKLITAMNGTIEVSSTIHQGTKVSFTVPFTFAAPADLSSFNRDFAGLEGKKVLIVDDNAASRGALFAELSQWGLEPVAASSATHALELIERSEDLELVITDHKMPGTDGVQLAQEIRSRNPKIHMLLLSNEGIETSKDILEGLFSAILYKPIKHQLLRQHIISNLRNQGNNVSTVERTSGQKLSTHFAEQYPLRILIAEDNLVNQKLALKILAKLGYTAEVAGDGKVVLEVVSNGRYELILMDVQMPEMDGLEATRMIRLCLETQPVIIAMTANSMQGDREECMQAGMDDYISKPVHIEELMILLEKWATIVKEKR
jgi:signal transduction histidine kinase/CheY-like chemotaxis protein